MSETLGDAFPKQQARLRTLLGYGKEIGPAGAFYCMVNRRRLEARRQSSHGTGFACHDQHLQRDAGDQRMRMTVGNLMDELAKMPKETPVVFQTGIGDSGPSLKNHVQRVDNMGRQIVIVVEKGA